MSEMLTITEIVNRTGFDRNALNRFLSLPANREFFGGADTHPLYPAASEPTFQRLAEQYGKGVVKPKTLEAMWRSRSEAAGSEMTPASSEYSETEHSESNTEQALAFTPSGVRHGAVILAEELIAALLRSGVVVGDDRLMTFAQAAVYLACGPRAVRRRVPPVGPGVVRFSDVQAYIRTLPAIERGAR